MFRGFAKAVNFIKFGVLSAEEIGLQQQEIDVTDKPATPTLSQSLPIEKFMNTNVFTVTVEMTLNEAIGLLLNNKIGGAPVVDSMSKVISMITESDLMKLVPAHGLNKKVGQCLSTLVKPDDVVTMKKNFTFAEIYKTFLSKKVHRVVIVDDSGRIQGLVSRSTVLRMLYGSPEENKAKAS